ncbi:hypothetical protein BDF22DRAFT_682170 [Syncephalis plumigaleata]|nr:hypothetical protein BDF22DRAFT_682170 [Syncephalis plumigaleata]
MTNEQISSHVSYLPALNGLACLATLIGYTRYTVPDSLQSTRSALLEKMNTTFDLVQTCFNLVEQGYTIISAMIRTFPDFISARWTVINATLQSAQLPKECEARVAALNTVEQFAKTVAIDTTWCIWWENTIDQIIQANCSDSVGSIRTVVCDILASLKNDVFEGLTVRLLLLLYDTLMCYHDLLFLSDATNAVLSHVIDRNLDVKLRVFWTVANICDLWVENSNIKTALLTKEMYLQVGKAILNGASDNVKIRPHAIRAIGSLILAADELVMGAPAQLRDMVEVVCSNVRWNACHTLSKMVRNVHFPMGQADWTCMMIDTLCGAIDQTRNYKVRIHACVAIRALPERGIKTATIMEDTKFTEYKYLNQLQQQLNDCGEYLLSMTTKEDQLQLSENLRVLQSLLTTSSTSDI